MITNSIHILLPALSLLLFLFCYKADGKILTTFYLHMACRHCWRKFYTRMLLLILLLFHFSYVNIAQNVYDLAPSSVAFIFLFSHRFTERIIYYLQNKWVLFISAITAMICLFVPLFFSTGITMGMLIFGARHYPSRKVRELISYLDHHEEIKKQPGVIRHFYYDWND